MSNDGETERLRRWRLVLGKEAQSAHGAPGPRLVASPAMMCR